MRRVYTDHVIDGLLRQHGRLLRLVGGGRGSKDLEHLVMKRPNFVLLNGSRILSSFGGGHGLYMCNGGMIIGFRCCENFK